MVVTVIPVTAVPDATMVTTAPLPDPVSVVRARFDCVPVSIVAVAPLVLSNNESAAVDSDVSVIN